MLESVTSWIPSLPKSQESFKDVHKYASDRAKWSDNKGSRLSFGYLKHHTVSRLGYAKAGCVAIANTVKNAVLFLFKGLGHQTLGRRTEGFEKNQFSEDYKYDCWTNKNLLKDFDLPCIKASAQGVVHPYFIEESVKDLTQSITGNQTRLQWVVSFFKSPEKA